MLIIAPKLYSIAYIWQNCFKICTFAENHFSYHTRSNNKLWTETIFHASSEDDLCNKHLGFISGKNISPSYHTIFVWQPVCSRYSLQPSRKNAYRFFRICIVVWYLSSIMGILRLKLEQLYWKKLYVSSCGRPFRKAKVVSWLALLR